VAQILWGHDPLDFRFAAYPVKRIGGVIPVDKLQASLGKSNSTLLPRRKAASRKDVK